MYHTMNSSTRCIMAPEQESIFAFTAQLIDTMCPASRWCDWTIYVPYARCISWLKDAFHQRDKNAALPYITPLVVPHPVSFQVRLGWMLDFLTPLVPHATLEHRLNLAQEALSVWEESIFFDTSWEHLSYVQEERLTQHHSIAVELLHQIAFDWPIFLQTKTDAYTTHTFIPHHHPEKPSLLMGSHGSLPTTRRLMRALLHSPQGWIIFPATPAFGKEAQHPHHPLYAFAQTLAFLNLDYDQIAQHGTHPAQQTESVSSQEAFLQSYSIAERHATLPQPISVIVCNTPMEEAACVADAIQRYTQEGLSVLCVSPDPILAHSIVHRLRHANIDIHADNALSLMHSTFAQALCVLWRCMRSRWPCVLTIDLLKHEVWRVSWLNVWACYLEDTYFRGKPLPKQMRSWIQRHGQHTQYPNIAQLIDTIAKEHISPLEFMVQGEKAYPVLDWIQALIQCAEGLWGEKLWEHGQGNTLKETLSAFSQASHAYGALCPDAFYTLLCYTLRKQNDTHAADTKAKIFLCGPREARLFVPEFSVCVMTSLHEGGWPRKVRTNPLIPASLQEPLNFPTLQWQIGLSARDFFFCLGAQHIVGTRLISQGLRSTSRFLLRFGRTAPHDLKASYRSSTLSTYTSAKPNVYCIASPFASLSVSDFVLLCNNPYAFYLKRILNLRPLDPLGADRKHVGIECHRVLELWARRCPAHMPHSTAYMETQMKLLLEEIIFPLWTNRVLRHQIWTCFQAFLAHEVKLRKTPFRSLLEYTIRHAVPSSEGSLMITTKIDRLDDLGDTYRIIDYKTGAIPKKITENEDSIQLWWMAWLVKHHAHLRKEQANITVQFMQLSAHQGFNYVERTTSPHLDTLIQKQIDTLFQYTSGQRPYEALETPNFTDGISRRQEWVRDTIAKAV